MASTILQIEFLAEETTDEALVRSLIFRAGGRVYRCEVDAITEIIPAGPITRIPGAPPHVLGIINVRGTIVTVVDAGLYLHECPCASGGSVMLVDVGIRPVGVLVDIVSDVRTVRTDEGYESLDVRAMVARVIAITEEE